MRGPTLDAFTTERLRAERISRAHSDWLAALHAEPDVMAMIGGTRTPAEAANWLEANLRHWDDNGFGQWMLVDGSGALVGRGGLRWIDDCVGERMVEVGYVLAQPAWGHGYATEATQGFIAAAREHYGFNELGAIVLQGNDASRRVLDKCGFVFERWVSHPIGPHALLRLIL